MFSFFCSNIKLYNFSKSVTLFTKMAIFLLILDSGSNWYLS
jgi:hypothetical protein